MEKKKIRYLGKKKRNISSLMFTTISIITSLTFVILIGTSMVNSLLEISTSANFDKNEFILQEKTYCMDKGMERVTYVTTQGFFSTQVIKSKCVKDNNEILIDHKDPMFCKFTMKSDLGLCSEN